MQHSLGIQYYVIYLVNPQSFFQHQTTKWKTKLKLIFNSIFFVMSFKSFQISNKSRLSIQRYVSDW
jgi:hypothetical protein